MNLLKNIGIVGICLTAASSIYASNINKPNIMFIFADDQAFDTIAAHGHPEIKTPNLDRLVDRGVTFTRAYNMGSPRGAVCVASRSMLNSGRFVNSAMKDVQRYPLWSQLMSSAGYTTYLTGKWHVKKEPVFDVVKDVRGGMPKQTKEGYNRPKNIKHYEQGWKPWDTSHGGFWEGGTHWTKVVADNTIEFFEKAKKDNKPFFMYLGFSAPHDPRQAPKEYVDMYPLDAIRIPKNYIEEYPYKDYIGCGRRLRDARLAPFPRTPFSVKVNRQEYYGSVTYMDHHIGRMLDALEASGKADNTLIIFTSDHGLAVGQHGLMGKQNMYEHSMRAPFIIAGPGIKGNRSIDTPIYLQDAMATALEVAGIEKPQHVEFKSVLPLIEGKRKNQYDAIYGKYKKFQRMIIKDNWKLIFYPYAEKKMRLYNLKKDPHEMSDLISNPEYAPVVATLRKEFVALQKKMGDTLDVDKPGKLPKWMKIGK